VTHHEAKTVYPATNVVESKILWSTNTLYLIEKTLSLTNVLKPQHQFGFASSVIYMSLISGKDPIF
jgi:hypothetical protein